MDLMTVLNSQLAVLTRNVSQIKHNLVNVHRPVLTYIDKFLNSKMGLLLPSNKELRTISLTFTKNECIIFEIRVPIKGAILYYTYPIKLVYNIKEEVFTNCITLSDPFDTDKQFQAYDSIYKTVRLEAVSIPKQFYTLVTQVIEYHKTVANVAVQDVLDVSNMVVAETKRLNAIKTNVMTMEEFVEWKTTTQPNPNVLKFVRMWRHALNAELQTNLLKAGRVDLFPKVAHNVEKYIDHGHRVITDNLKICAEMVKNGLIGKVEYSTVPKQLTEYVTYIEGFETFFFMFTALIK